MEIIPVIDVLKGQVVQATGGSRLAYPPLKSQLTSHIDMIGVVADLLAFHPFQTCYIADLDAIMGGGFDPGVYQQLANHFPALTIWLDAGIKTLSDWQVVTKIRGVNAIIGSETLQDKSLLENQQVREHSILSLDCRAGELLGEAYLPARTYWSDKVIVMSLDVIGAGGGPDIGLLTSLREPGEQEWVMAGGVRDADDLLMLYRQGVSGVLIASALHSGAIQKHQL
jgi:phosphoribosylformimino-5-aminoimidazole carboxamide ribotide isomerase